MLFVRSSPARHNFTINQPQFHHQVYVNQLYVGKTAKSDSEAVDCGELVRKKARDYHTGMTRLKIKMVGFVPPIVHK